MRMLALGALMMVMLPAALSAQEPNPDLSGLWRFDMISPAGVPTLGAMTVMKNKSSGAYEGRLITNGGIHGLPIRSLRLQSGTMSLEVESEHGPIRFTGELAASGQAFSGTTIYHDGRPFRMTGLKQEPLAPPGPVQASR